MFKRKSFAALIGLMVSLMLVVSGCSSSETAQESLQKAFTKSADIRSYELSGSVKLQDLNLPPEVLQEEGAAGALGLLKNTELSWTGAYRADPMLMELSLKIATGGDLAMSFQIPIVMNSEKMWIKIPNIPMLGLPEDLVGKFVELDLKKLAEQQGTEWLAPSPDPDTAVKLLNDIYGIVFKHIDEKQILSEPKPEDVGIPKDMAKRVVQLHVTKEQIEPFLNTLVRDIAPEVIELLSQHEEYRKMLQLEPKDLDEAKRQLSETKDQDIKDAMTEFNKSVKDLEVTANVGIDKDGYASYDDLTVKVGIEDDGQSGSGAIKIVSGMSNINGSVHFENGEPKADQIIPMDELQSTLGDLFGAGGLGEGSLDGRTDDFSDSGM